MIIRKKLAELSVNLHLRHTLSMHSGIIQRLDLSCSFGGSYDAAMIQYLCTAQVVEKQEQKKLALQKKFRVWVDKGLAAVKAELSPIPFINVFTPVNPVALT